MFSAPRRYSLQEAMALYKKKHPYSFALSRNFALSLGMSTPGINGYSSNGYDGGGFGSNYGTGLNNDGGGGSSGYVYIYFLKDA